MGALSSALGRVGTAARAAAVRGAGVLGTQLTPGQRYTAALALGLAVVVVAWGLPEGRVLGPSSGVLASAATAPPPAAPAEAPQPIDIALPPPLPETLPPPPLEIAAPAGPSVTGPLGPVAHPKVVALARTGDGLAPGRDDEDMANAYLFDAGFEKTFLKMAASGSIDPELCGKVAGAGTVVLASYGIPAGLRDCLVGRGLVVIAHDALGDLPPAPGSTGQVLSTGRGVTASLLDLGAWAASSGALRGTVGIVASSSLRDVVEAALPGLAVLGIRVAATAFIGEGAEAQGEISDGVRDFAGKGIEVVLFALPVDQQRRWVAQQSVVQQGVRYVVSDGANGILDEAYPPSFEGALAHTALRVPWYARTHVETPTQERCRLRFEQIARKAVTNVELSRAFMWCQHVTILFEAIRAGEQGVPLATALRGQRIESPLTSDLAPLAGGGYGPTQDAVLQWKSSCACWTEVRPYADRPA